MIPRSPLIIAELLFCSTLTAPSLQRSNLTNDRPIEQTVQAGRMLGSRLRANVTIDAIGKSCGSQRRNADGLFAA
jgi:hypothetical protein